MTQTVTKQQEPSSKKSTDDAPQIETSQTRPEDKSAAAADAPLRRDRTWWLKRLVTPVLLLTVGLLLIVALGFAQRRGWISAGGGTGAAGESSAVIHTCPMHPQIRQPGPGRCPICGMALEPAVSSGADAMDEYAVHIEPAARRLANIQTAPATRGEVFTNIETVGKIAIDESRMATIAAYVDGRIERLFADYTGVQVADGDHLAVLYSPELYADQVAYLKSKQTLGKMKSGALGSIRRVQEDLVESSRQRLVELGVTEEQFAELEKSGKARSRLTIYAPIGGTVTEKTAVEGKYVKAGDPIYRIANLSTVWLMLELFPQDASRVRFGQQVEAEVQSLPGAVLNGRIAFIDPVVDEKTRTVGVRVEFLNTDGKLRPGDYATARIQVPVGETGDVYDSDLAGKWISPMHPQIIRDEPGDCPICGMDLVPTTQYGYSETPVPQPDALVVPRSAVLMAGKNSVVYVETEPGRFEIRPVALGPILKDRVVILGGVKEGEEVATAGNFLIDSQMQLAGKPSLIDPAKAIARKPEPKGPLELADIHVESIEGEAGKQLERLYNAYFTIQAAFASDQKPTEAQVQTLLDAADGLKSDADVSAALEPLLAEVLESAAHLHHMELEKGRKQFRPLSRAVLKLAAKARSAEAKQSFNHFYCPMYEGGADWLQADGKTNPYFGSEMLKCGDKARELPVKGRADSPEDAK